MSADGIRSPRPLPEPDGAPDAVAELPARRADVEALRLWLVPNPNGNMLAALTDRAVYLAAEDVLGAVQVDGDELVAGLRKLLEAQECFRRAAMTDALADAVADGDIAAVAAWERRR